MTRTRPRVAAHGRAPIPRTFAACLAVLLLAAACATTPKPAPPPAPRDTIVLLPDAKGKAGAITVTGAKGKQTLSKPRQAVSVAADGAPGKSFVMSDNQVRAVFGPVIEALPTPPVQFILYFKQDSAELTPESAKQVASVLRVVKERSPVDISVVGHTDTVGNKSYNYQLSLKRARAVAAILIAEGVDASILDIASHGKDNPLIPTGDQVHEPRNRRVEVTVR